MRVVFCGGGTGGHVYPALAVASALRDMVENPSLNPLPEFGEGATAETRADLGEGSEAGSRSRFEEGPRRVQQVELLYIGVRGKIDRSLAAREHMEFRDVTAGPLRTSTLAGTAKGGVKLAVGTAQALAILQRFNADVVFATGGYGSVGVGLAARTLRKRLLLFLPDVEAGLAVRTLVRVASRIAVTVPPVLEIMPSEKTVLTGYPVRDAFFKADRQQGRERLGLDPGLPTLLVSGASSGASRLNESVSAWAQDFLKMGQLIHLCGEGDEPRVRGSLATLPPDLRARYHLHAYLHDEMPLAMAAADLAVMRSGASVLGELPATGLPAILVPGEYEGWDQSPNARYLDNEGAAVMLRQSQLEDLHAQVMYLINNGPRLQAMRKALARLAQPEASGRLAGLIMEMARKANGSG
jgi:UDP-N-acetylglucosamine--N-acetylmuramyl-(pentapeptide) pyrophosphoryl-undecaprenol N-acetylglucosamine transferase